MGAEKHILHLEDDDNDAYLVDLLLRRSEFSGVYTRVTDGLQGTKYMLGQGAFQDRIAYPLPDLILCDLKLPRMTGFEFIHWLRERPEFAHIPVITLSSSNLDSDKNEAFKLGANKFLTKAATYHEWIQVMQEIISQPYPVYPDGKPFPRCSAS